MLYSTIDSTAGKRWTALTKHVTSFKLEGVYCIKWFQSEIVVLPSLSRSKISRKEPVLDYVQTDALFSLKLQHDQKNGMYDSTNLTIHFTYCSI